MVNNLRDIPGDTVAGKNTLAVKLGDAATRRLYVGLIALGLAVPLVVGLLGLADGDVWPIGALAGLLAGAVAVEPVRTVRAGAMGPALVPVLGGTGRLVLVYGVALAAGIAVSALAA